MPSKAPFLARWSPRIGHRAARLHLLTGPSTTIGIWSAPVWLILYLVGQGWSRMAAYAVAGFGFACLAFATLCMHLMYKALSVAIRLQGLWRNAPPYRYKAFGTWCRRMAWTRPPAGRSGRRRPPEGAPDQPGAPHWCSQQWRPSARRSPRSCSQCPIAATRS